jgi:hypothetical protein
MLPSISNEVNSVTHTFETLVESIDEQNELMRSGEVIEPDANLLSEYSRLRAQMKARMEEIAVFYEDNLDDEKIHFFEKLRLKIKKTLLKRPGKAQRRLEQELPSPNFDDSKNFS